MEKEDIVKYVMHTPANTNPAVLRSMLGSVEGGGGGSDTLILTCTPTTQSFTEFEFTVDKTASEIRTFLTNHPEGRVVAVFMGGYYNATAINTSNAHIEFSIFFAPGSSSNDIAGLFLQIDANEDSVYGFGISKTSISGKSIITSMVFTPMIISKALHLNDLLGSDLRNNYANTVLYPSSAPPAPGMPPIDIKLFSLDIGMMSPERISYAESLQWGYDFVFNVSSVPNLSTFGNKIIVRTTQVPGAENQAPFWSVSFTATTEEAEA